MSSFWSVECILAVMGTGGPVRRPAPGPADRGVLFGAAAVEPPPHHQRCRGGSVHGPGEHAPPGPDFPQPRSSHAGRRAVHQAQLALLRPQTRRAPLAPTKG
eukprot:539638-Prorocentrum_minimum.AAC.1